MPSIGHDLKVAVRSVGRSRFVSLLAVVAFALGIGVTTAVFSIFNSVLLRPLPYPDSHELVAVYGTQPACPTCPASFPKYNDWKTRSRVFAAIGGLSPAPFVLTGRGEPMQVLGLATTASLMDVFRVRPAIGRWYTEQEDQFGGPKVVVLSQAFWQKQFAGDPRVVGRTVTLDGDSYEVIGVMPPGFEFRKNDVFVPLQRKLDPATRGNHFLATFARLKKGVTVEQAAADMRALGNVLAREFGHNHGIDVRSYYEVVVGNIRTPLTVLLAAVVFVLLIACANVANLTLASSLARRRELGMRLALGASRWHIGRQLGTETLLLALAGGAGGLALAHWTVRLFVYLAGNQLPRATTIQTDGRVFAFAAAVSLLVGVVCGIAPLVLVNTRELASAVREGDARTTTGGRRFGGVLVAAEMAIAFTLLVGAGLLVKNLVLLRGRDSGLRTDRAVAFDVGLAGARYRSDESVVAFYRDLYARLSAMGTIESMGLCSHLPMYRFGYNGEMSIEGGNPWQANQAPLVEYRWVYGDYFKTVGVRLLKGRLLDARDGKGTTTVLVNQAMADKFWPGKDPLGRRFGDGDDLAQWYQVVGIVSNVRSYGLVAKTPFEFYRTIEQSPFRSMTVVIRTRGDDATAVVPTARKIIAALDSSLPVTGVQTLDSVVAASVGQPRLMSALTAVFALLAGLLAMVGVYGVMAYNVRRQRREFGIRLALGATQAHLGRLVIGRTLALTAVGIAVGAFGAWSIGRVLTSMLNDVKPSDPSVFAGTAIAMVVVALLASALPARAAGRVDPIIVLRDS
ncbi:MAG: ABC transporter permease [Bacteroidales bacterium]